MAPNLKELSLRRLKISNNSAKEIFTYLEHLEKCDISDCFLIGPEAFSKMIEMNSETIQEIQASNCQLAITDETVK